MPDEPVGVLEQTPDLQTEPSTSTTGDVAATVPPPLPSESPAIEPTPEQIDAYIQKLSHDDLAKKVPGYNGVVSRNIEKARREAADQARKEAAASAQRQAQLAQARAYFDSLDAAQLRQTMLDPRAAELYRDAYAPQPPSGAEWERTKEQWASEMLQGLHGFLKQHEDFQDMNLDDLLQEPDFVTYVDKLTQKRMSKREKAMRKEIEAEYEAKFQDRLAKAQLNTDEAEPPAGATVGINGGANEIPNLDAYQNASTAQRDAWRKSGAVDRLMARVARGQAGAAR